jgi:hypothetical protein
VFERTDRIGIRVDYELLENLHLFCSGIHIAKSNEPKRFESHIGFGWNL